MRSEKEMMDLIITIAKNDKRIRAAYLEGSRANPNVPKDIFKDYDVGYIVKETMSFRKDKNWIDCFGKRLYMQYPEESVYYSSDVNSSYGWLIQFADGNRLDLHVRTIENALKNLELYKTLLDKDGCMPLQEDLCEERYFVKKPTQEQFLCTCNEFWWCLNNVAKGLWREELPYVMEMIDFNIRSMLTRVLEWKIGQEHQFSVNIGKSSKYMKYYLPKDIYEQYLKTYGPACSNEIWKSVFQMCDLFHETALELSEKMNFTYNREEAQNSRFYLEHVKQLPKDANKIF